MPTKLKAPLPDLDLPSFVTLTVDAGDPGAVITAFTIHVSQDVPFDSTDLEGPRRIYLQQGDTDYAGTAGA